VNKWQEQKEESQKEMGVEEEEEIGEEVAERDETYLRGLSPLFKTYNSERK
jgi:hypothetical protein